MSNFTDNIYSADRVNQSVALLGGATAQSYRDVGLRTRPVALEHDAVSTDPANSLSRSEHIHASNELPTVAAVKPLGDVAAHMAPVIAGFGQFAEDSARVQELSVEPASENAELVSMFESADADSSTGQLTVAQTAQAGESSSAVELAQLSSRDSSLFSFIEQVISQVQGAQDDESPSFDGEQQGAVRALIDDTTSGLEQGIRSGLQDNVAGVGRELIADALTSAGLDVLAPVSGPFLVVDYYGESANLINGVVNPLSQSISSVSLPAIGPFLSGAQENLSAFPT